MFSCDKRPSDTNKKLLTKTSFNIAAGVRDATARSLLHTAAQPTTLPLLLTGLCTLTANRRRPGRAHSSPQPACPTRPLQANAAAPTLLCPCRQSPCEKAERGARSPQPLRGRCVTVTVSVTFPAAPAGLPLHPAAPGREPFKNGAAGPRGAGRPGSSARGGTGGVARGTAARVRGGGRGAEGRGGEEEPARPGPAPPHNGAVPPGTGKRHPSPCEKQIKYKF